ncbi:hypothetical protein IQ275_06730 [Nostoc sp. LEGE 12450]|nr:hypothetical protein [Nostoc sp. LEGE 12450]
MQADNLYTQVIDSHATFRVLISVFGIPRLKDHVYHPEHLREELKDFLQKSGKGEGERGKGFVFSPSPLTFSLFPALAKSTFARGQKKVYPQKSGLNFWHNDSIWHY